MSLPAALFAALIVGMVALHMARPSSNRRVLSSARFFQNLPPAEHATRRWQISNPFSLPMIVRTLILALLLWSLLPWIGSLLALPRVQGLGLWILVDSSGSMAAQEGLMQRIDVGKAAILMDLSRAVADVDAEDLCLRLSTFDLALQDHVTTRNVQSFAQALADLRARPLGTDLTLVRAAQQTVAEAGGGDCAITHLIVVSDQPPPDDLTPDAEPSTIWRTVGTPVPNVALTSLEALRNPLTGLVDAVSVTVTSYGDPPNGQITVQGPDGATVLVEPLTWQGSPPIRGWRGQFATPQPGRYVLDITPGGALDFDDHAEIDVPESEVVRIDWQLPDATLPVLLGWPQDAITPHLRVLPAAAALPSDNTPTLVVGSGLTMAEPPLTIGYFLDASPLLADLNLDVVERAQPPLFSLSGGFLPVLQTRTGETWLAWRAQPPAAYVPALPTRLDDASEIEMLATTAFFNAVRWLLGRGELPPLYTLTDDSVPMPTGTRLALHLGESNTFAVATSLDPMPPLTPRPVPRAEETGWPLWLVIALALLLLERSLAAWRGERWR